MTRMRQGFFIDLQDLEELKSDLITEVEAMFKKNIQDLRKSEYMTVDETAEFLKITRPTVYEYINKGILMKYRIGNKTLLKMSEVEKAIIKLN